MKTTSPATLLALVLLSAACAAETPPLVPSWDLDVYPILRGSCSHCHGVAAATPGSNPATRYDVCNAAAFAAPGVELAVSPGANAAIAAFVRDSIGPSRMPPPPAAPLSDYEATILERWAKRVSCDKQVQNRKPIVRIIQALARNQNRATVTIEVSDPDGDQVLGKVKLGTGANVAGNPFIVQGAGRWTIEFANAGANDRLSIFLFDGYEPAQFMP
jgi:hypothetical protein